jgi:hypothetical protein
MSNTTVSIHGAAFHINGRPTYEGRWWNGHKIEGIVFNSRMIQGIYDDMNPDTVQRWAYPDTGVWDPERNTREFIQAMPQWRNHGLLGFFINLQGGSPEGYSNEQPWHNSALAADGTLLPQYMDRLKRILDQADALGMIAIVGLFYFGQDQRLTDEAAVCHATDSTVDWLLDQGYTNILLEINNECNVRRYDHPILQPQRIHELITRAKERAGDRLLVGTSYGGGTVAQDSVVRTSDFILLHGNGVSDPNRIAEMVPRPASSPLTAPCPSSLTKTTISTLTNPGTIS